MPSEFDMEGLHYLILFLTAAVGGAVNSVAGGGTLLTFPALLWIGRLTEVVANATSTVALWPGQLGSLWGYRKELGPTNAAVALLAVPSFLGGLIGALLLLKTSNESFRALVPYLILGATLLFVAQEPWMRWQRRRAERNALDQVSLCAPATVQENNGDLRGQSRETETMPSDSKGARLDIPRGISDAFEDRKPSPSVGRERLRDPKAVSSPFRWAAAMLFQLLVATYGGYFGAGIGILMLAALGFLGFSNIHRMNAIKNINGMCINVVAAVMFIVNGLVDWRLASLMAAGAILGGYAGAGTARRLGQENVRRIVVLIGFSLTISLLIRG